MIKYERKLCQDKLTVAVSGGVDSVAVAHFLHRRYDIRVFHFNHKYRPQNDSMEESVVRFCKDHDIPCLLANRLDYQHIGNSSTSKEAQARDCRLAAASDIVHGDLVTAHHLDDAIESYFMNFLRGCPAYAPIPAMTEFGNINLCRPFLLTRKSDFSKYISDNNLRQYIVVDETNTDMSIRRNWVRHEVLPMISSKYPGLPKVVRKMILTEYSKLREMCYR